MVLRDHYVFMKRLGFELHQFRVTDAHRVYWKCSRYCPECRTDSSEVVLAGEKLKESKKKSRMASASSSSQRDWGKVTHPFARRIYLYHFQLMRHLVSLLS